MSVSKWNYSERCEGRPCPGDCDMCRNYSEDLYEEINISYPKDEEVEQDGWKTWNTDCSWDKPEDLGETDADIQDTCDSE